MTTKSITKKLSLWGDPESESYQKGLQFSKEMYTIFIYNLLTFDRLEESIRNRKEADDYIYQEGISLKETRRRREELYNEINQELEPLRNNIQKATKALDLYLRTSLIKAKQIVESVIDRKINK